MHRFLQLAAILVCGLAYGLVSGPGIAADDALPAGVKPYPLKTCVVSGEELGSMGKPVSKVHEGQEIKFCCKNCIKKFDKDPAAHLKKITEAQSKGVPGQDAQGK